MSFSFLFENWIDVRDFSVLMELEDSMITSDIAIIRKPANITLLSISAALVPAFVYWMGRQERLQRPALIPNSIWKNRAFTAVCLMVLLSFAAMQTMELFVSLL